MLKLTIWCVVFVVSATNTHGNTDDINVLREMTLERIDNVTSRIQRRLNATEEIKLQVESEVAEEISGYRNHDNDINQKFVDSIYENHNASSAVNIMTCMGYSEKLASTGKNFIENMETCAYNMLNDSFQLEIMLNLNIVIENFARIRTEAELCDTNSKTAADCYHNATTKADYEFSKFVDDSNSSKTMARIYRLIQNIINTCKSANNYEAVEEKRALLINMTEKCIESKRRPTFVERVGIYISNVFESVCNNGGAMSYLFCVEKSVYAR